MKMSWPWVLITVLGTRFFRWKKRAAHAPAAMHLGWAGLRERAAPVHLPFHADSQGIPQPASVHLLPGSPWNYLYSICPKQNPETRGFCHECGGLPADAILGG